MGLTQNVVNPTDDRLTCWNNFHYVSSYTMSFFFTIKGLNQTFRYSASDTNGGRLVPDPRRSFIDVIRQWEDETTT